MEALFYGMGWQLNSPDIRYFATHIQVALIQSMVLVGVTVVLFGLVIEH